MHSGTTNTKILVWVEFGFGSLNTKILNPFEYLTNFNSGFYYFFGLNSV